RLEEVLVAALRGPALVPGFQKQSQQHVDAFVDIIEIIIESTPRQPRVVQQHFDGDATRRVLTYAFRDLAQEQIAGSFRFFEATVDRLCRQHVDEGRSGYGSRHADVSAG